MKAVELKGEMTMDARKKALEIFASNEEDAPRVLIVSNVGSVGLNIQFANIIIFLVRSLQSFLIEH